jgi:hypothetical protein
MKNMVKVSGASGAGKTVKKSPVKAAPKAAKTPAPKATGSKAVVTPEVASPVEAVQPKLVTAAAPVVAGPEMKKKDLIDKVVKRAGIKKKDVKPVVEAMLAVLAEALGEGRELVVQPLGRIKVTRVKDTGNGRVMVCRVRQGGGGGNGRKEGLAEGDD